jgi:hypothetical protein
MKTAPDAKRILHQQYRSRRPGCEDRSYSEIFDNKENKA